MVIIKITVMMIQISIIKIMIIMTLIRTTIMMMMLLTVCQGAVSDCSPVYWWTEAATR